MSSREREIGVEIIEACRRGEREAFHALYEAYKDKVYSIALYFFHGDRSTASDVTQQVFMKLITEISRFRGDAAFSTWLYRMVVNACVDAGRRSSARRRTEELTTHELRSASVAQEERLHAQQLALAVQQAVSSLPEKYRIAILLRYFDDMSYDEMADVLHCSTGTVASRLNRAHRLLAGTLRPLRTTGARP